MPLARASRDQPLQCGILGGDELLDRDVPKLEAIAPGVTGLLVLAPEPQR